MFGIYAFAVKKFGLNDAKLMDEMDGLDEMHNYDKTSFLPCIMVNKICDLCNVFLYYYKTKIGFVFMMTLIDSNKNTHVESPKIVRQESDEKPLLQWVKSPSLFGSLKEEGVFTPFKTIRYMATHCLVPFVQAAARNMSQTTISVEEAQTSCLFNMRALSIIFSGIAKANFCMERINYTCDIPLRLALADKSLWSYTVNNLFSGRIILAANRELPNDRLTHEFANRVKKECVQPYLEMTQPMIERCYHIGKVASLEEANAKIIRNFEEALTAFKYDFNRYVISSLQIEMHRNNWKGVNEQTSFVYYISIHKPITYEVREDEHSRKGNNYYHAFVIEQFKGSKDVLFRLYNSWRGAMTLIEHFQKKNYGDGSEGCMTYQQVCEFLKHVHLIVSPTTDQTIISELRKRCFEYGSFGEPFPHFFDSKMRLLKGLSLRYVACEFNPKDCLENFHDFMQSEERRG